MGERRPRRVGCAGRAGTTLQLSARDNNPPGGSLTSVLEAGDPQSPVLRPVPRDAVLCPPPAGFRLESGVRIPEMLLRYETYGTLNAARDNVVWVFHALSGSAHLAGIYDEPTMARLSPREQAFGPLGWWADLVGPGRLLDTRHVFVVCANHPGSCYGSTGPCSTVPGRLEPFGPHFPRLTIRDLARAHALLMQDLGIPRATLIGGSLGGMVALEFALLHPDLVRQLLVIGTPAVQGPWSRAWNRLAREAIVNDPSFRAGRYGDSQPEGLALARALSMLSYRSPTGFAERWLNDPALGESYVLHHGAKFVERFDANAYLTLSHALDSHDVGRDRPSLEGALARLQCPALCIGIDSDILYHPEEVRRLAAMAGADYRELSSPHGHDAFLIDSAQLAALAGPFLRLG